MQLECLERACEPGISSKRNEDLVYCDDSLAIVLDGATGLGEPLLAEEDSDARWLVHTFANRLIELFDQKALILEALEQAVTSVAKEFWQSADIRNSLAAYRLPSAGMALAAVEGDELVLAHFGDCSLLTFNLGVVQSPFPPSPLELLDRRSIAALHHHLKAGLDYAKAREAIKDRLKKHRNIMNTPHGYSALSVDPHCLTYLEIKRLPFSEIPQRLLLASDGFSAAFDHYGLCSAKDILSGEGEPLASLVKHIRCLEREDAELRRYPRLKPHDDASALLVSITD